MSSDPLKALAASHILVVEDEPLILMDIEDSLLSWGVGRITAVDTIAKAVHVIRNDPVSAALLDVHLRAETSGAVALELSIRGIPFLFTSGSEGTDLPAMVANAPFFEKPFDWPALKAALTSAVVG